MSCEPGSLLDLIFSVKGGISPLELRAFVMWNPLYVREKANFPNHVPYTQPSRDLDSAIGDGPSLASIQQDCFRQLHEMNLSLSPFDIRFEMTMIFLMYVEGFAENEVLFGL